MEFPNSQEMEASLKHKTPLEVHFSYVYKCFMEIDCFQNEQMACTQELNPFKCKRRGKKEDLARGDAFDFKNTS